MSFLIRISSILVAVALLFTGLIHASQPYLFIHTIGSYRLLPPSVAGVVGLWLPYLQITLGVAIGCRGAEKTGLEVAAVLFALFAAAQFTVLARGLQIDCGCFGFVASTVTYKSATLPSILAAVSRLAAWKWPMEIAPYSEHVTTGTEQGLTKDSLQVQAGASLSRDPRPDGGR